MCSLYLPMKRYPVCITFIPTAYATIDTTIIHHVYKPDFAVPFFHDRKLGPVCHQIGCRVRSSFLLGQCEQQYSKTLQGTATSVYLFLIRGALLYGGGGIITNLRRK